VKRREAARREILAAAWEVAREHGLAALTLREVAERVGMRAPSLYTHFESKHAIYDAMFGEAWCDYERVITELEVPKEPRAALRLIATTFFEYAMADLARHQLMNVRAVPDFAPSQESYAPSLRVYAAFRSVLAGIGVTADTDADLLTALISGLIHQQWANDPDGVRWARLIDRVVEMFANDIGLPKERT
jgi:AcrR family transcriptional regulator